MDDVNQLKGFRISNENDKNNEKFLQDIAKWYRQLHSCGKKIDLSQVEYSEYNVITKNNILKLKGLIKDEVFAKIELNIEQIISHSNNFNYTLAYNDFFYDNAIIGVNESFMFDYNLLGKGCISSDINNVTSILGEDEGERFLNYYGKENIPQNETEMIYVPNLLANLITANSKEKMPNYAKYIIDEINSDKFFKALNSLI